ncbi:MULTISPECIES: GntR family transcriptional regulator [Dietzia]|uniref:GntR family transcriptional regulator n=1 Tax=Dietzia TaxID=37914 RepID=UPI000D08DBA0|nr:MULTISPECIES: GntR family transcriptional regulator [Dietzia]AVM63117.1 GntR family transcriptional regulator [Dietzia sp. oral taxon 368]MCT1713116.1 GntR family transcriptional regulator [Dietzia cinnamea]MCT2275541.1 GntR family transcriptional regulator [Dietzia cinnamea]
MQFDTSSPIWVQLVEEFSRRIVTGDWAAGTKMPGVRELAAELGVNPNTAQRALAELERLDLCRSERATGRFVTSDEERIDEVRADLATDAADSYVRRVRGLGMTRDSARALLEKRWDSHDDHATTDADTGDA